MNTTDILIVTFIGEQARIDKISDRFGLPFKKTAQVESGGPKKIAFEAYGISVRCLGKDEIVALIGLFKAVDWDFPECVSMSVHCDNNESLEGVYVVKDGS